MTKITRKSLADYKPATNNPNQHTERGLQIIEDSINYTGAGRSGLADKDGVILAGNGTLEAMARAGIDEVLEVEADGHQWVIVKRTDLSEHDAKAKSLMIADNRASQLGYAPDDELLGALLADIAAQDETLVRAAGFNDSELRALLDAMEQPDGDVWGDALGNLPDTDRAPFQQMTFTLHDDQAEEVFRALKAAKALGEFDSDNENSNGNALARICEDFITHHGQG